MACADLIKRSGTKNGKQWLFGDAQTIVSVAIISSGLARLY